MDFKLKIVLGVTSVTLLARAITIVNVNKCLKSDIVLVRAVNKQCRDVIRRLVTAGVIKVS